SKVENRKVLTSEKNINDKIDAVLTNRWLGIPIFAVVMFLVFDISQSTFGPWVADTLVGWIEGFQESVAGMVEGASPIMQALLVDGIIGGVGAVVGFLPLVMVMYFLIALLEDCGYMARVSVVLDPIFKKVGLSGKSVIPFVIGTGCAIPGIMACRTIRNERERRATAMLTPFMPCGAKLPVIALFAGVFFADASWVGTMMYFVGIALIFFGALLVNKISGYKNRKSFFIIELPEYKLPSLKRAFLSMCSRGWAYIVKAGTIILLCNTAVQIMQTFDWSFNVVEEGMESTSILASIASPFALILVPLGFGVWQMAAAAITGFIAKENVVGTLAVCSGVTNFIDTEELALVGGANEVAAVFGITKVAALACLMFNLYTPPCFAAIGAMNSEIKDRKWMMGGIALQLATGYVIAFFVNQIGTLITTGAFADGFFAGLIVVCVINAVIIYLCRNAEKKLNAEYALGARA
ncbi:MAG: ferrous iron transporter B, partial [Oscillospiraceae bacterium]|nr:ferrous iron transporter B [Oscillospiraceae bacterium]